MRTFVFNTNGSGTGPLDLFEIWIPFQSAVTLREVSIHTDSASGRARFQIKRGVNSDSGQGGTMLRALDAKRQRILTGLTAQGMNDTQATAGGGSLTTLVDEAAKLSKGWRFKRRLSFSPGEWLIVSSPTTVGQSITWRAQILLEEIGGELPTGFEWIDTLDNGTARPPQILLDTTYREPTGGTTHVVDNTGGGDFTTVQGAVDAANPGDVIEITAGQTFNEAVSLPAKTNGNEWIYIKSSELDSIPAGKRVHPSNARHMPKITTTTVNTPTLKVKQGARRYRLSGIKLDHTGTQTSRILSVGNDETLYPTNHHPMRLSEYPYDIVIDRCLVTQNTTNSRCQSGIALESRRTAVVDCFIWNIVHTGADSNAVGMARGVSGFLVENCYLEAAAENFITGGENILELGLTDHGFHPHDIVFRRNQCRKPINWEGGSFVIKNSFELKSGKRSVVYENVFENIWGAGQDGTAIVITGNDNEVDDLSFQYNLFANCRAGLKVNTGISGPTSDFQRLTFRWNYGLCDHDNLTAGTTYYHQLNVGGSSTKQLINVDITDNVWNIDDDAATHPYSGLFPTKPPETMEAYAYLTYRRNAWRHGAVDWQGWVRTGSGAGDSHEQGFIDVSDANLDYGGNYFIGGISGNYPSDTQYADWGTLEAAQTWVPALRTDVEGRINRNRFAMVHRKDRAQNVRRKRRRLVAARSRRYRR